MAKSTGIDKKELRAELKNLKAEVREERIDDIGKL